MEDNWAKITKKFPEANFLQSPKYGKTNQLLGEKVVIEDFDGEAWALMIVRDAKRGRYLEIPCGPLVDWEDAQKLKQVFTKITEVAKREKCVFVRIRPQLLKNEKNLKILADLGLRYAPMHLAAEHTIMLDLTKSEDELLKEMRRQTRYEVRRAEKLGMTVEHGNSEELFKEFRKEQAKTAVRQNFVPPSLKTLMAERKAFGDQIEIYVAKDKEGAPVAYGMIIKDGREGDYYEAASTNLNRKLPGAYMLLWQVIKDLKKEGYERFNLWGIAPEGQPRHRYAGVTTFKKGFGGDVIEYAPAHDLVITKIKYLKNWVVETGRKKWRHL